MSATMLKTENKTEISEGISEYQELQEYYVIKNQEADLVKYDIRFKSYFKTIYINSFHFNLRKTYVMSNNK